jgi:predicted ATPase/DNA-binding winged helix-turn-helix (wHTH) protein
MSNLAILTFGGFELSPRRRTLSRDGHGVRVGSRAMDMLLLLAGRAGELVTKDEIQQHLWPGIFVDDISVRVHISALRKALGVDGVEHIHTVAGRGYMFVSEITRTVETEPPPLADTLSRLPTRLERLIGRAASVESIATQVLERRFVTVVGPGGIGKTSVALEVAARLPDDFSDGVYFVDLATLDDPETAPGALALALGLPVLHDLSANALAKLLAGKRLLILLDNCERQADVAARVAEALLRSAKGLCVLATSREALRAEGEWLHHLPPLSTPPLREATPSVALQHSAIELFVDRVDAAAGGYRLTEDDCAHVVEICRRLDGLPLAIELAATTVAALGIRGVAEGLDDRLALLTGGRRTAQSRHQTLRAAHDWSYELLSADERRVLNSLSVVASNFDIALAGAVADNPHTPQDQIRGLVGALSGKSLIAIDSASQGARYRLLESTRAYALEKLQVDSGEHRAAQNYAQATLTFFLGAAEELTKFGAAAWLARHASRLEDARAVLEWAFSAEGDRALARALTAEVSTIWLNMGLVRECLSWCRQALAPSSGDNTPDAAEMRIRHAYGVGHSFMHGTNHNTRDNIASILETARRLGDHDYGIRALWALASVELNEGRLERALHHAAQLRDAASGPAGAADRLVGERIYGSALHLLGRHAEARGMLQSARDGAVSPTATGLR